MMTYFVKIEGIVLQAIPFHDYDRILTLFSPMGLLKLFVKGRRLRQPVLVSPLTEGEYLYSPGRNELHRFKDGSILDQHYALHTRLESLETAQQLISTLLCSQWQGKPSPQLYMLFRLFLRAIPQTLNPHLLVAAFQLKVLKHEGIWQCMNQCQLCEKKPLARVGGEGYCEQHAPPYAQPFSQEEKEAIDYALESRSIKEILTLNLPKNKIERLMTQVFDQKGLTYGLEKSAPKTHRPFL